MEEIERLSLIIIMNERRSAMPSANLDGAVVGPLLGAGRRPNLCRKRRKN
jgi:hypothetical protein